MAFQIKLLNIRIILGVSIVVYGKAGFIFGQNNFLGNMAFFVEQGFLYRAFAAFMLGAMKDLIAGLTDCISKIVFESLVCKKDIQLGILNG